MNRCPKCKGPADHPEGSSACNRILIQRKGAQLSLEEFSKDLDNTMFGRPLTTVLETCVPRLKAHDLAQRAEIRMLKLQKQRLDGLSRNWQKHALEGIRLWTAVRDLLDWIKENWDMCHVCQNGNGCEPNCDMELIRKIMEDVPADLGVEAGQVGVKSVPSGEPAGVRGDGTAATSDKSKTNPQAGAMPAPFGNFRLGHYIIKCKECSICIEQCRCMSAAKPVYLVVCDECKNKEEPNGS